MTRTMQTKTFIILYKDMAQTDTKKKGHSLGIATVPRQPRYVPRADDGADGMVGRHLNLILRAKLEEMWPSVGEAQALAREGSSSEVKSGKEGNSEGHGLRKGREAVMR